MAKKPFRPPHTAPLQRITAEPITDSAEQAAIDRMRKRLKRKTKTPPGTASRRHGGPLQGS